MASGDDLSGGDFSGDSGGTAETKPDAAPRILVETCEISPQEYRAGDRVDVRLVLRNTSKKKTLRNIRLTFTSNTGEVLPVDAAPDRYIELHECWRKHGRDFEAYYYGDSGRR